MWGNSLGWGISAAIVATVLGSIAWLSHSLDAITPPTDFPAKYGVAEVIALSVDPSTLLPAEPGPSDPLGLYRQAIDVYQHDHSLFDHFASNARSADLGKVAHAVSLLCDASGSAPAKLFAADPEEVINYAPRRPALDALAKLGNCALNAGALTRLKDKAAARKDFEAAFTLGNRMYQERLTYLELSSGLGLMNGAAKMLAEDDSDSKATAFKNFGAASEQYSHDRIEPVQGVLSSVNPPDVERHAGDIFWVAQHARDRMWRVEAILSLGRYKYNAPTVGDNRGALRVTTELAANDPDPIIKLAATLARDLTLEQYNMLH